MNKKSIGKYVDLELLGRGGMAEVYSGRDPNLDRRVAIKVILPHLTAEESFEDRFRREARLVAALRHANIVQIYEFDFHEDQPFMVMEYLPGGTLKDVLARYKVRGETIPLREIAELLQPIAQALDFAHARGAVHRDIKPANILFSSSGEPVIADFGIAKILDESLQLTVTGEIVGSPYYMSPEQAASKPVEKYSDIYSLGVVVYEMAVGRVPFIGDTITGVLMQHLNDPPPPVRELNPNIPLPLNEVIAKVLAKNPGDRFPGAGEFSAAFKLALQGEAPTPVSLTGDTVTDRPQQVEELPLPSPEMSATVPEVHLPETAGDMELRDLGTGHPTPARGRRRWPLVVGIITVLVLLVPIVVVISSGGLGSALGYFGLTSGGIAEESDVLLYSSLDDEDAITAPGKGIGGYASLQNNDYVPAKEGNGVLFDRAGGCDILDSQEVSFPAWEGDEINVDLQAGELAFWYRPLYDATDPEGVYTLAAITLDGDSPSSVYLFYNEGYFNLNVVDSEGNWLGTSAGYREPFWASGDWVRVRAVWDSAEEADSLQLFVDDLRVDSGGVPGGWLMDAGEVATRIYIGSLPPCGEEPANGIIDEFVIRRLP
jgi:serine/threonine protein kinase